MNFPVNLYAVLLGLISLLMLCFLLSTTIFQDVVAWRSFLSLLKVIKSTQKPREIFLYESSSPTRQLFANHPTRNLHI